MTMRYGLAALLLVMACSSEEGDSDAVDGGVVGDTAVQDAGPTDSATVDSSGSAPDVASADAAAPDAATVHADPEFVELPPARSGPIWGFMVADVGDGTAYVFGGTSANAGGGTVFDAVRRLDANLDIPSFVEVAVEDGPSGRYCGCAAWDPVRSRAVVSGGRDLASLFPETWVFDPAGPTWTRLEAETHPSGPVGCTFAYSPDRDAFYHFGGGSMNGTHGEMWRLDAEALTWTKLPAEGPRARYDAELITLPDGDILMIGGGQSAAGPMYADTWRFSVADETWQLLEVSDDKPAGRRIPWVVLESDRTLLYGFGNSSMSPDDHYADLWRLDWVDGVWTRLEIELPSRRGFTRALPGGPGAYGLVLGGFDGRIPIGDQWVLLAD